MNYPRRAIIAIALAASLLSSTLLSSTPVNGQTTDPNYLREMPAPERILNEIKGKDPQDTIERQMGAFMALTKMIDDMAYGLEHRYMPTRAKPDEIRIKDMYGRAYADLWHKAVRKEEHKYDHDWDLFDELMAKFFSQSFKELYSQSSKNKDARIQALQAKNSGVVFGAPPSEEANKEEVRQLCKAKGLDEFTCMVQSVVKKVINAIDPLSDLKPGLTLSGVYVTKTFSVFLMPNSHTWVNCGDVFLQTQYGLELKGDQVFVNIENGNDSFALRMQADGSSLIGSGTVPIHGYSPGGGGGSSTASGPVSSTEVTTTRQRELTPLEANQYQNAVKNGQTYTINETTTSTEYTTPTSSQPAPWHPKTAPCRADVLALKPTMAEPGEPKVVEGLRMIGTYLGDGGAHIQFLTEKAIVACGQTIVDRSYYVSVRNGGQIFINIPGNGGAESFSLKPDGILTGTGATVTLNGKRKPGVDRLGDAIYVQSSDTCTYGILAPPGKSRRSTPASNTTAPPVAKNSPGPTSTTKSVGPPVLTVTNGFIGQPANPLSGRELLVLKASFEEALRKAGFQDPPGAAVKRSAVAIWAAACKSQTQMCKQGIDALQGFYAGKIRLDQSGTASVSGMPQGSFWILGLGTANGQHFVWDLPIEIKPGSNSIAFITSNATIIY